MTNPIQSVFSSACGLLMLLTAVSFGQQNPGQPEGPPPIAIQPITFGVLLIKGGSGANSGLIIGNKEVIAIDAKMSPESVQEMLAELKKKLPYPVTKVILTHSDADHINGLPGFPRGVTVISQEQTKADMIQAAAGLPALQDYLPTLTFKDGMKIQSGKVTIELRYYGPAHTSGDTVVYIDADRSAYVGDLVFVGRDPIIHREKNGTSFGLVKTIKAILDHRPHADSFLPGHGDMLTRAELENLARSIEVKQSKIRTFIAEGKTLEEIKKILGVDERPGASAGPRFPSLVEVIYQELTEKKDKK